MERGYAIGLVVSAAYLLSGSKLHAQERLLPAPPAGVQTSRDYGIDFVTVNPTGAAVTPYTPPGLIPPPFGDPRIVDRPIGNVPYAFRMARTEVTTSEYLDFVNLAWRMNPQNRFAIEPTFWGGRLVENSPDNMRWELNPNIPNAADIPVYGMAWIQAAWFCNYLQNGRQNNLQSLMNGAYDATTFGELPGGEFTGQITRNAAANYWIPSIDEWAMAGFYDPNRSGQGQGGWWSHPNGSEQFPVYGPPGTPGTTANSGWHTGSFDEFFVPVGSFDAQSPWGLFDVAGSVSELTEGVSPFGGQRFRWAAGSYAGIVPDTDARFLDSLGTVLLTGPGDPGYGLRIASSVPAPGCLSLTAALGLVFRRRR